MTTADFIVRQLGLCAGLISPADHEWLAREMSLIEAVARTLAKVEKGRLDFAAMWAPPASPAG